MMLYTYRNNTKQKKEKNGNKNNNRPMLFVNYIYILMYDLINIY